jgi:low affinity Fe/Cu permease
MSIDKVFESFAHKTAKATGTPWAFGLCLAVVLGWAASGPVFRFSETWQLVINTGTTIVTFLMVFLIQNTQNRDSVAVQAKLDELILTSDAENAFMGIEKLTTRELEALHQRAMAGAETHRKISDRAAAELRQRKGGRASTKRASAGGRSAAKAAH